MKKLAPTSHENCIRLFSILMAVIIVCSFFAQLISSDGGKIKIESIQIDPRGAELNGDLYYPVGTNDEDSYPAVILAPGAGVTKENMRGFAEELAKRGYVVFNVNPYGSGMSETPVYNENDNGVLQYNIFATPLGVLDAVNYLRTVEFVDSTRIGLSGHSQGSRRTGYAGLMDCGYYSLNDYLLMMLNENFGVEITAEDINTDADAVAAAKLSVEQLASYEIFKAEIKTGYDSMVKSMCLIGSTAQYCNPTSVVEVCGIEVTRTCKVNMAIINGEFDFSYLGFNTADTTKEAWYIPVEDEIVNGGYYVLDDVTGTSKLIGSFRQDTIGTNAELKAAIDNRALRSVMTTRETHSKNFFSRQTTAMVIDYFAQTLDNNSEAGTTSAGDIGFMWRELLNAIAMLAMVAILVPVAGLLTLNAKYKAGIEAVAPLSEDKKRINGIIIAVVTIACVFMCNYWLNSNKSLINFSTSAAFPLMLTAWTTPKLCVWLAAATAVILVVYIIISRNIKDFVSFVLSNLKIGVGNILRSIGAAFGFIVLGYLALSVVEYLFQQDFRFWMTAFGQLKANHWMYVASYAVLVLPWFIIISLGMNYVSEKTMGNSKLDVLLTVIINSAGIWLCCLINYICAYGGLKTGALFSSFLLTYGAIVLVPINCFVIRKSYKLTKNIWFGAIAVSLLAGWMIVSISGMNGSYVATTWLSNFLGM